MLTTPTSHGEKPRRHLARRGFSLLRRAVNEPMPERCTSDLSGPPVMIGALGPLPCEVTGEHDMHERWSPPAEARWYDDPGGGRTLVCMRTLGRNSTTTVNGPCELGVIGFGPQV